MINFIQPYNPAWKTEYESLKNILDIELKDFKIDIQHVGSTSIPGLYAKPILDIDIVITDKNQLNDISEKLEKSGYLSKGEQGIAGRFAFRQTSDFVPLTAINNKWQSHHLYVCYSDSLALKNHLLFRDILRNDNVLMEKYSELKKTLTNGLKITREEYTTQKTDFIISVLAMAGLNETELQDITNANN